MDTIFPACQTCTPAELEGLWSNKCQAESYKLSGIEVHLASFQAYKTVNEDKYFVHNFEHGTLIGVLDGHLYDKTSEYLRTNLPPFLASMITTCHNASLHDEVLSAEAIPEALRRGFVDFDSNLLEAFRRTIGSKQPEDWHPTFELHRQTFFRGRGHEHNRAAARRILAGSTALVAYIDASRANLWIANLGDGDAYHFQDNEKEASKRLNNLHNSSNPLEKERIRQEHPGEPDELLFGKTGHYLLNCVAVTRGFGDGLTKLPPIWITNVLWACKGLPVPYEKMQEWDKHCLSPPYMIAEPEICHRSIKPHDILVLGSDGFFELRERKGWTDEERSKALLDLLHRSSDPALAKKLGHSIHLSGEDVNLAETTIRNWLWGTSMEKLEVEVGLPLEEGQRPERVGRRDDITLVVARML